MSLVDRGLDSLSFLTDDARDALRRRLRELTGVGLIVLAMLLAIALATWSVQDPSLSHATNTPVKNLLGIAGATVADLLMQLFGIASLAIVLPTAIFGWRRASPRDLYRERWRLLVWVVGVVLAAAFAASLPRTHSWPLPAGLGGVTGDMLWRWMTFFASSLMIHLCMSAVVGVAAIVALAFASGIGGHGRSEPAERKDKDKAEDDEDASIGLGLLVHGFLSLKARFARFLARRRTGAGPLRPSASAPKTPRAEPRFENYQAALRDLEHEDAEDDEEED